MQFEYAENLAVRRSDITKISSARSNIVIPRNGREDVVERRNSFQCVNIYELSDINKET